MGAAGVCGRIRGAVMSWVQSWIDDFNRANSTAVGNGWSQGYNSLPTTYGVYGNKLYVNYAGTRIFAVHRTSTASKSRAVRATLTDKGSSLELFVARRNYSTITTSSSGYGYSATIYLGTGQFTLNRNNNGTQTSLAVNNNPDAKNPTAVGTEYELEHLEDGTITLRASVDGGATWVQYLTVTDTTYMSTGDANAYGVGVRMLTASESPTCSIDDFTIYEWQASGGGTTTIDALFFGAGL